MAERKLAFTCLKIPSIFEEGSMISDATEKVGSREVEPTPFQHPSSATRTGCFYGQIPLHSLRHEPALYTGIAGATERK
jgi:hypothetical protein